MNRPVVSKARERPCAACKVRDKAVCGCLPDDELGALARAERRRKLARGEVLHWAGSASIDVAIVISGVLGVVAGTADGHEQIVDLLYPGDVVGRPYHEANDFSVRTLIDAELCIIPKEIFERLLHGYPGLERAYLRRTLTALDDARWRILGLGRSTARQRVARLITELALRAGGNPLQKMELILPLTRAQMADMLGLTIETVSRQMTHLRRAGIIDCPAERVVVITDGAALASV